MSQLMTVKAAAESLALSDSMIRKLIRAGHLSVVRVGRSVRVRVDDIASLVARGGVACSAPVRPVRPRTDEEDTDVDGVISLSARA